MYYNDKGEPCALITDIQRYTIHDGPGIRTELFFKGCTLHCLWCGNPETVSPLPQPGVFPDRCVGCGACVRTCPEQGAPLVFGARGIAALRAGDGCRDCLRCAEVCPGRAIRVWGEYKTLPELLEIIEADRAFYQRSGGGVTCSGGEALVQWEFLALLLKACRARGIRTCVESALNVPTAHLDAVLPHTDLLICDIKCMDSARHRADTGCGNELILQNVCHAARYGVPLVVRTPVVPGHNDSPAQIAAIGAFLRDELGGRVLQYQLLPYRKLGTEKLASLGQPYPLGEDFVPPPRTVWEPKLAALAGMLREEYGLNAFAGSTQGM